MGNRMQCNRWWENCRSRSMLCNKFPYFSFRLRNWQSFLLLKNWSKVCRTCLHLVAFIDYFLSLILLISCSLFSVFFLLSYYHLPLPFRGLLKDVEHINEMAPKVCAHQLFFNFHALNLAQQFFPHFKNALHSTPSLIKIQRKGV